MFIGAQCCSPCLLNRAAGAGFYIQDPKGQLAMVITRVSPMDVDRL